MSETTEVDDMVLSIEDEDIDIESITFERSDDGRSDGYYREAMVTSYEMEISVEAELSLDSREEYVQHLIDMGYSVEFATVSKLNESWALVCDAAQSPQTVVREMDGEIIAVADGIEVVNNSE